MLSLNEFKIYFFLFFININSFINCWPSYHLYTRSNPQNYVEIFNIENNLFSNTLPTKFLIHGFSDGGLVTSLLDVKNEILKKENANVIVVDWEEGAAFPLYLTAAINVKTLGTSVGNFIVNNNINPKNVHCIGHSLGAHACGYAGKVKKLARISGLDPAGPGFKGALSTNRLDKADADLVDNIHTDGIFGINDAIGHKDYYPSGGVTQPGCGKSAEPYNNVKMTISFTNQKADAISILACSHLKVIKYFVESVNSVCKFTSTPCDTYDKYSKGRCQCSLIYGCSQLGYNANLSKETGKFFLDVNSVTPFCKK